MFSLLLLSLTHYSPDCSVYMSLRNRDKPSADGWVSARPGTFGRKNMCFIYVYFWNHEMYNPIYFQYRCKALVQLTQNLLPLSLVVICFNYLLDRLCSQSWMLRSVSNVFCCSMLSKSLMIEKLAISIELKRIVLPKSMIMW